MSSIRGCGLPYTLMVTIEPIMDFDFNAMVSMISRIEPEWVNIGANTNHKVKLPEPAPEKIQELIFELEKFTKIKIKKNLNRWHNHTLDLTAKDSGKSA